MLTLARLALDDPLSFNEGAGDPIGNTGASVTPAQRTPLQDQISLSTFSPVLASDTLAVRQRIKRQLRSLLNNTPTKLRGLYVAWDQDTEQNGWYVPDRSVIGDGAEAALATGFFRHDGTWSVVGKPRTHRRATTVYAKDLRTGTAPRDYFKTAYSTDFSTLPAFAQLALPCNLTDVVNATTSSPFDPSVGAFPIPRTTRDGGTEYQLSNAALASLLDYGVVTYEQPETNRNQGDVVAFDRRGNLGPFGGGGGGYSAGVLALSPSLYWRHGEPSGTTATDSSGNGHTGTYGAGVTVNQPSLLTGDANTAIALSGAANGSVTSTYNPFTGNATFTGWINMTSLAAVHDLFGGSAAGTEPLLQIQTNGDVNWWSDLGAASVSWGAGTFTAPGVIFWALTWNNATKVSELFINAVSKGTKTSANAFNATPGNFQLATTPASSGFLGTMDETAVFAGSILTPTQLANLYALGAPVPGYDTTQGILDPQTNYGWEEVYGPDYPLTSGDVPVLENGRCRVRYSAGSGASGSGANQGPGFRVEVYNGTTWVEQGIFAPGSATLGNSVDFTLTSVAVLEWSPDRAALLVIGTTGAQRVRMVITLQRGWSGPRVEVYNPATSATSPNVTWFPVSDTLNDLVAKNDNAAAPLGGVAWSGAGTPSWPATQSILGAATMVGENWFAFVRAAQSFNMTIGVVQVAVKLEHDTVGSNGIGYGSGTRSFAVHASSGLYVQANLAFWASQTKQRQEAESMTLGTGTASTADANASAGNAATATRTTDANPHVTDAATGWTTGVKYRVFLRVKVSANTATFQLKTATSLAPFVTTTSTSYVWIDAGEVTANGTFEIHAWVALGGTVSVDCYVAVKVEDRYVTTFNVTPALDGARDVSAADLIDTRGYAAVVTR